MPASRIHPLPRRRLCRSLLAAAALQALALPALALSHNWSSGTFVDGVTAPNPLPAIDTLNVLGGGSKFLSSETLVNLGTINWQAAGEALYMSSSVIDNQALFDVQANATLSYYSGGAPSFLNAATATVHVASGQTLGFGSGVQLVNNGGALDAAVGAAIVYGSNAATFNAGTQFSGAGTNLVTGNATFNGGFSSANLALQVGTYTGSSAVVNGLVQMQGGSLAGDWTVASGQELRAVAGSSKFLGSATLTNNGTVTWQAAGENLYQSSSAIDNNALFDVQQSLTLNYYSGGAPSFTNAVTGTLQVAAGQSLGIGSGVVFTNNGGILDAAAGASIVYASGAASFNAGTRFTGSGVNAVTAAASFNGAFQSNNLSLQAGTATGSGAVINGTVQFQGGAMAGDWAVASGQSLTLVSGPSKFLSSAALTNNGTLSWQGGADNLYLSSSSVTNNASFEVQDTLTMVYYSGGAPSFTNAGTGTVHVAAGRTLGFGSGVQVINNGGVFDTASGAQIVFASSAATFNDGTRFTGAGGSNIVTANARFVDGFNSQNLELRSGTFSGGDGVTPGSQAVLSGVVSFTGGTLSGDWQVAPGQSLNFKDGSSKFFGSAAMVNRGTLAWRGASDANLYLSSSTVSNQSLFDVQQDAVLNYYSGSQPVFTNTAAGLVQVAASKTLTVASIALVNDGGRLDAAAGATINYASGAATFNAGTQFTGAGVNAVTGNASFNGAFDSANLSLQGGTFSGSGALANGTVRLVGGAMSGDWTVAAGQTLAVVSGASKFVSSATITNQGTLTVATSDPLYLSSSTVNNNGLVQLQTDGQWTYYSGGTPALVNSGTLVKTGGSGNFDLSTLTLTNTGTMEVQSGSIGLPTNFSNAGTLKGSGTFGLGGVLINAGHVAPGASPGTLNIAGSFAQTAGGSFDVELGGTAGVDLLRVSGSAALGGTLALSCWGDCSYAAGSTLVILESTGTLSGSFASMSMSGFASGAFTTEYDLANSRVLLHVTQDVTAAVPEPGTWAMWLAGLAVLGGLARRRYRM